MKEVIVSFDRDAERHTVTVTIRDIETLKDLCMFDMGLVEVFPITGEEIYLTDVILAICGATFKDDIPTL